MRKIILYALLAGLLIAAATAHAGEKRTIQLDCWTKDIIAKAVSDKKLRVIKFWNADFEGGKGMLAQLMNPSDGSIVFFVIDADWACMLAASDGGKPEKMVLR